MLLDVSGWNAVDWILVQQLFKQVSALRTEILWDGKAIEAWILFLFGERSLACEHFIHEDSDAPAVYLVGVKLSIDHFWRDVVHGAA